MPASPGLGLVTVASRQSVRGGLVCSLAASEAGCVPNCTDSCDKMLSGDNFRR